MSGIEDFNREAFRAAEAKLRADGLQVITPCGAILPRGGMPYRELLTADLEDICKADAIYMLSGWEHSPGARAEHAVAVALKLHNRLRGVYPMKCRTCGANLSAAWAMCWGFTRCYSCLEEERVALELASSKRRVRTAPA